MAGRKRTRANKPPRDVYQDVTNRIIAALESDTARTSWPWHTTNGQPLALPKNAKTGNEYNGLNVVMMWAVAHERGYKTGKWATMKQWNDLGFQVRKGEKSTPIVFWKQFEVEPDENDPTDKGLRMFARYSNGFNADQVEGYEPAGTTTPDLGPIERIASCEAFIAKTGADIRHGGDRAFYDRAADYIHMPAERLWRDNETGTRTQNYYSVLMHELTHWTGAKKRLERAKGKKFGDREYAIEELIAELGAAFLCAKLGIENEPRLDHAQYIGGWLKALKSDKRFIFTAASAATKAVKYLDELKAKPATKPKPRARRATTATGDQPQASLAF